MYLVRHAEAGERELWRGDDRLRPLSRAGLEQADRLAQVLAAAPMRRVVSSPYLRCLQTVEPLARSRSLAVESADLLAEGAGAAGAIELVRMVAPGGGALCSHGDVIGALVEHLVRERVISPVEARFQKGSAWILELKKGRVTAARYLEAPGRGR